MRLTAKTLIKGCIALPEPLFHYSSPVNPGIAILDYVYVPPKSEDAIIQEVCVVTFPSQR